MPRCQTAHPLQASPVIWLCTAWEDVEGVCCLLITASSEQHHCRCGMSHSREKLQQAVCSLCWRSQGSAACRQK